MISLKYIPFHSESRAEDSLARRPRNFLSYHEHEGRGGLPGTQDPDEHDGVGVRFKGLSLQSWFIGRTEQLRKGRDE